jgi:UrcA family protein
MLKPLLTTALLFAAVPAIAGDKPAGLTVRVATADLDLATATGRRTLDRRIRAAVDEVCRPAEEAPRTGLVTLADRCRAVAAKSARRQRTTLLAAIDTQRQASEVELASAK